MNLEAMGFPSEICMFPVEVKEKDLDSMRGPVDGASTSKHEGQVLGA